MLLNANFLILFIKCELKCELFYLVTLIIWCYFATVIKTIAFMNKLKFTFFLIFTLFICNVNAQTVTLYYDKGEDKPRKSEIPIVRYDDETVTISADSLLNDVYIIIKDEAGQVIYNGVEDITAEGKELNFPDLPQSKKYSIELYTDDKYMYGYF
mgnify:CR=1 FL=1